MLKHLGLSYKCELFTRYVNYYKKKFIFLPSDIGMSGKNITFSNNKISKSNFYTNKKLFNIDHIDVTRILNSKKEPYGKKTHLIALLDIAIIMKLEIRPLCIKLT